MSAAWEIPPELLSVATPEELEQYAAALRFLALDWRTIARPEQLPPDGDWRVWYLRGGRGSGKTRSGAEDFAEWLKSDPPGEWGVVGPDFGHARDVMIEGGSGLLRALGPAVQTWNRSLGELRLKNGSIVFAYGAKDGAPGIQGHNLCGTWCDEIGKWQISRIREAWDEGVQFATRLGRAQIICTATPKQGHPLVRRLIKDPRVPKTRLRTLDNADNLSPDALQALIDAYENTRLGKQELEGEFLEDVEGALWVLAQLEAVHVARDSLPVMVRTVVAVDPSGGDEEGNDEQGIMVVGKGADSRGYVLADRSCKLPPRGWAERAVDAAEEFEAGTIVVEKNYGGDMAIATITQVIRERGARIRVHDVTASRGKAIRAEPIAALYGDPSKADTWETSKVAHVGELGKLESQMTKWTSDSKWSPDRMDALVWGLTELFPARQGPVFLGIA